jgi:hypothetical protein
MDLVHLLLFLHITLIFVAISASYGPELLMRLAYVSGQIATLRGVQLATDRLGPAVPILYLAAGLFGLLTAINFGYDLLAPWLVIAYVLFALAMVTGLLGNRTFAIRLGARLATTPDGPLTPEIRELFSSRGHVALEVFDFFWIPALVFDMVVKPFS